MAVPVSPLAVIGDSDRTGTKITFKPDHEIFTVTEFSYDILASRLRELSFLNAGFVITLLTTSEDRRHERREIFEYKGGIREFVEHLNKTKEPVHDKVVHIIAAGSERVGARRSSSRSRSSGTRATPSRSSATRTTSTTRTAARTSPAFARRSPACSTATATRRTSSRR